MMRQSEITGTVVCLLLLATIMSSASNAQNDKSAAYFCTSEALAGLKYNKLQKKWEGVGFTADHKFVLRLKYLREFVEKNSKEDKTISVYEVTMTDAGENFALPCTERLLDNNKEVLVGNNHLVFCNSVGVDYKINLDRNRYLGTYAIGYAVGSRQDDEHSDQPQIEGGTCTKID
jgi:hypothetical protein